MYKFTCSCFLQLEKQWYRLWRSVFPTLLKRYLSEKARLISNCCSSFNASRFDYTDWDGSCVPPPTVPAWVVGVVIEIQIYFPLMVSIIDALRALHFWAGSWKIAMNTSRTMFLVWALNPPKEPATAKCLWFLSELHQSSHTFSTPCSRSLFWLLPHKLKLT